MTRRLKRNPREVVERIIVTEHAVMRAQKRLGRNDDELSDWIAKEVREALSTNRILDIKPKWARLYREPRRQLLAPEKFVHNLTATCGWIVKLGQIEDGKPVVVVMTTIQRVENP